MVPNYPVKVICPGKVFRRDDDSTPFPYVPPGGGPVIDKNISLADLKGTLLTVLRQLFGADREIRLRPSILPVYRTQCRSRYFLQHLAVAKAAARANTLVGWRSSALEWYIPMF